MIYSRIKEKKEKIKGPNTLDDYKKYFEENQKEFESFGCKFDKDESGNKRVDLNEIGNPKKFDLFGQGAIAGLRNLNKALGNIDEGVVKSIPKAQKILKEFFKKMGYRVE